MADIAAAKKAEGNAFFSKKMYKEAADCYSVVRSLFSLILFILFFVGYWKRSLQPHSLL